jgi:hypothetical protein
MDVSDKIRESIFVRTVMDGDLHSRKATNNRFRTASSVEKPSPFTWFGSIKRI